MAIAFLKIVSGSRAGLNVPLSPKEPLVVGRKEGDLLLEDPLVSSKHCQIFLRGSEVVLQDLGSTNGTMVEGRLVREIVVKPGHEITIGGTRLLLFSGLDAPAAEEPGGRDAAGAQTEIAWLLDEELVEDGKGVRADVISQDLRIPPGMSLLLEVIAGEDHGKIFRFNRGNMTIGRQMGDVPLGDVEASRRHAMIEVFGREMLFLRDLNSTNGTYHNGRRVTVGRLKSGDTIGVGKSVLKLQISR